MGTVAVGIVPVAGRDHSVGFHFIKTPSQIVVVIQGRCHSLDRFNLLGDTPDLVTAIAGRIQITTAVIGVITTHLCKAVVAATGVQAVQASAHDQAILAITA